MLAPGSCRDIYAGHMPTAFPMSEATTLTDVTFDDPHAIVDIDRFVLSKPESSEGLCSLVLDNVRVRISCRVIRSGTLIKGILLIPI
jgi:hypothetical protein